MKTYYVFTHYSISPVKIEANSRKEAVALGVKNMEGAMIEGGYRGAEVAGNDGPLWIPARPATPHPKPYAALAAA